MGRGRIALVKPHLRAAAVQMRFARTIEGNLAAIGAALLAASRRGADAVLFPECAVTGYAADFAALDPADVRRALRVVSSIVRRCGTNALVGCPVFRGRRLHNALVVFDRDGEIVHCYAKCHLTEADRRHFAPGDAVALFEIDGVPATAILCHERRYPELARLGVMAGARIVFHPNAGMDTRAVSAAKRGGRDGLDARAFENAVYYVFANSVGPQGRGRWSAGDSKIVAPDRSVLAFAGNENPGIVAADLDLSRATRSYAEEGMARPAFLSASWRRMVREVKRRAAGWAGRFDLP